MMTHNMRAWVFRRYPLLYAALSKIVTRISESGIPRKYRRWLAAEVHNPTELLQLHYAIWVRRDEANRREGFSVALQALDGLPANILETGTSAWGVDSTRLFDAYAERFGGRFCTIDIRPEPSLRLAGQLGARTRALVGDSVATLKLVADDWTEVDLLYLDSYDLDWQDPRPSALHCLAEWNIVVPLFRPGTIIVVDDTPRTMDFVPSFEPSAAKGALRYLEEVGRMPGKGELILTEISSREDFKVLHHSYSLVVQFSG